MGQVFISYSSHDRDRVAELAASLQRNGFEVWWDTNLPPGEDWDERIQRALESARTILVVWSQSSMASREVRAEATYGLQEKKLLPIRVEDVKLWARYNIVQYEDIFARPPESDPNWNIIVSHLRRYTGTPEADGAPEVTAPIAAPQPPPPARGGAVIAPSMILPSVFTGAGGLTFLIWLVSGGGPGLGSRLQLYSAVALLAAGLVTSLMAFFRTPRAR